MDHSTFWTIITTVCVAAVSYGGLFMRVLANESKVTELKKDLQAEIASLLKDVQNIGTSHFEFRLESVNRLARIEEKIDRLGENK